MDKELLTLKQVAKYFRISKVYVIKLFRKHNIFPITDKSKNYKRPQYFFRKEDIQVLLRKLEEFTEQHFPIENRITHAE